MFHKIMKYFVFTYLTLFITLLFINYCFCEICESKTTCGQCVSDLKCAWFISEESNRHCKTVDKTTANSENVVNPQNEGKSVARENGQISVKEVQLKIRPGQPYLLNFTYKQLSNSVDMYFLMDMSLSMLDYRTRISILASELIQSFRNLTDDVQIGFGSFIDKAELPYSNVTPEVLNNPTNNIPYVFKNHLPLTNNIEEFSNKINNTPIAGNIDGPEGSLEALMQAIVCSDRIGWRKNARHIIVLSTDDQFHIAGDGKLAGIVQPNDGLCHLDDNNVYSHEHLQDYPSISQIRNKIRENNVIVIFVVSSSQFELYTKLKNFIKNSYVGILQMNSENIIDLIRDIYKNIANSIEINNDFPDNFNIELSSNCTNFKEDKCEAVRIGETIKFQVKISLTHCPDDKFNQTYYIKHNSITENIAINVRMLCDCPCEYPNYATYEKNSSKCSFSGDLQCGVCKCIESKTGSQCECSLHNNEDKGVDEKFCIQENATEPCSGVGDCICGQCKCLPPMSGSFCECNNDLCILEDSVCSNHGFCDCGKCNCVAGWEGDKCECTTSTDDCKSPKDELMCSGNNYGKCKCGKCECKEHLGHKYSGDFCQICSTCPKQCSDFDYCIQSYFSKSDNFNFNCTNYKIFSNDEIEFNNSICALRADDGCLIKYFFNYFNDNGSIIINANANCVSQATLSNILLSIIGTIIGAGLLIILIWKGYIYNQDRKEYAKFLTAKQGEVWEEVNPLFKNATTTFKNPLYEN